MSEIRRYNLLGSRNFVVSFSDAALHKPLRGKALQNCKESLQLYIPTNPIGICRFDGGKSVVTYDKRDQVLRRCASRFACIPFNGSPVHTLGDLRVGLAPRSAPLRSVAPTVKNGPKWMDGCVDVPLSPPPLGLPKGHLPFNLAPLLHLLLVTLCHFWSPSLIYIREKKKFFTHYREFF